jgi:O-antigen ligase
MGIPVLEIIRQLDTLGILILASVAVFLAYLALTNKVYALFFFLVFGASFTGSTVPIFENLGSITRWVAVLLLLLSSLFLKRMTMPLGSMLFLGYVAFGFIGLLFSGSDSWQFQRTALLIAVAVAIPIAFGDRPWRTFQLTLIGIAGVATIFSIYNFTSLPAHLGEAARLSGYAKAAPWFAMVLGSLLPFSLWGFWNAPSRALRLISGAGFFFGTITLVFSGQRAGTVAGLLGVAPLLWLNLKKRKTMGWTVLILILVSLMGFFIFRQSSTERMDFLLRRYDSAAGLSNREEIWEEARAEIGRSPLLGRGTGAAERVLSYSFHNTWLEVWYNTGLPGLVLFLAAQIYFFYRVNLLRRSFKDPEAQSVLALALGFMLGFLALCIFESVGAGASNVNIVLYIFLGVFLSSRSLFEEFVPPEEAGAES